MILWFARAAPPAPARSNATFDGLKRFQSDNGLKVDGLMRPGGPTETAINRTLRRVSSPGGGIGRSRSDLMQRRDDAGTWTKTGDDSEVGLCTPPNDNFNMDNFIAKLDQKSSIAKSGGKCATWVRIALEAGEADTGGHPVSAKDYDATLKKNGFTPIEIISEEEYTPQKGDIIIFQPYPGGNQAGHIQVWNGQQWV